MARAQVDSALIAWKDNDPKYKPTVYEEIRASSDAAEKPDPSDPKAAAGEIMKRFEQRKGQPNAFMIDATTGRPLVCALRMNLFLHSF